MSRITATFSVSLPPEMATQVDEVMKTEHRTRSELIREALRRYFDARENIARAADVSLRATPQHVPDHPHAGAFRRAT